MTQWLTPAQVSIRLNVSRQRLQQLRRRGTLKQVQWEPERRRWVYDAREIEAYELWRKDYHALTNYTPPSRPQRTFKRLGTEPLPKATDVVPDPELPPPGPAPPLPWYEVFGTKDVVTTDRIVKLPERVKGQVYPMPETDDGTDADG